MSIHQNKTLDVSTILQVATEHNATPPLTESTSLSRIIPLMLATLIGGAAFFIGLWANRRGKYMLRKIVVALLSICAILIAAVFGWTYDQYFKMIKKTCKDRNNTIYCARHEIGIEVVIFAIALVLLFIAFIFWFFASAFFTKKDDLYEQEEPFSFAFWKKRSSEIPEYSTTKRRRPIPSEKPLHDTPQYQSQDELAVWRDVNMYDGNDVEDDGYWEEQHEDEKYYNNKHGDRGYYYDSPVEQQHNLSSMGPNEKVSLTPPPPVSTNHLNSSPRGHKSRVTSNDYNYQQHHHRKNRKSSGYDYYNNNNGSLPQKHRQSTARKESSDSALTFGNSKRQQRRKSSGRPLSELDQQQQYHNVHKPRSKTPTSMSPHPFQFPNNSEMMMRNSFCMTPYYNEDNGSSGSGSSNGGYFIQDTNNASASNQFQVPILGMPPAAVEHPLNKKVITDKRIQSYLQQHSNSSNSN